MGDRARISRAVVLEGGSHMLLMQIDDAVELIRMEYDELPGLKLTFWQAQRLWNLSDDVCARALQTLTEGRFLTQSADGAYVRSTWPYATRFSTRYVLRRAAG
jgi:hypothetical protein